MVQSILNVDFHSMSDLMVSYLVMLKHNIKPLGLDFWRYGGDVSFSLMHQPWKEVLHRRLLNLDVKWRLENVLRKYGE